MAYFNSKVKKVSLWAANGARSNISPGNKYAAYDYKGTDEMYDIRLALLDRPERYIELTKDKVGIPQLNNGNPTFHPLWPLIPIVVFTSEAGDHYLDHIPSVGDPGVGLFHDIWALNVSTGRFYKLTNYPIKMTLEDGIVTTGTIFPRFNTDGTKLLWSHRYASGGGVSTATDWGRWKLVEAPFSVSKGRPSLGTHVTVYDPDVATSGVGNYVVSTAGYIPNTDVVVMAGNHDGQHEYNMDLYLLDISQHAGAGGIGSTGIANLMPLWGASTWEEGSAICPISVAGGGFSGGAGHKILYMSSKTTPFAINYNADWSSQEKWNELWYMTTDGLVKNQLTKFNRYVPVVGGGGPGADIDDSGENSGEGVYDEFIRPWGRAHPAVMDFSSDGLTILVAVGSRADAPYPMESEHRIDLYRIDLNELL